MSSHPAQPLRRRSAARAVLARAAVAAALVLLAAAAAGLQYASARWYPQYRPETRALYVPSGAVLQRLALSFDPLLADVYWIRALQHYGRDRLAGDGSGRYELLYPLLDIATTLDPRFDVVYRAGAVFLAETPPSGAGRPDQALALLQKGLRARPGRWQYLQDIGFVHYWWLHDYATAAHWFRRASEQPGAPWWLRPLAAETLARGGNREGSRTLWRQMHETADNAWLRTEARRRLQQIDALEEIDVYAAAVARFVRRAGRPPSAWTEVLAAPGDGPRDPAGHPYTLDSASGAVAVSSASPLFPLPAGPPTAARR